MSGTYIYAIIPTADRIVFDVDGIGDNSNEVYTIPYRDLAAVVSDSPRKDYQGLQRDEAAQDLVAHQQVVETVMQSFPVLPVKFGTVLPDETWVERLLTQGESLFRSSLESFATRVQMEVVVLWNLEEVFQAIGQEEKIVKLKEQIGDRPPEETMAERVVVGQLVQASLQRRRAALRERIVPSLRDVAQDVVINPPMDDNMVANVALLVDEAGNGALDTQLDKLDEELDGRLLFRCVGPLPPYSFATVNAEVPSFEEIDEARRRLDLGETATPLEIKRAYRKLAGQIHPDHNPDDPETEERMSELTEAYELLQTYGESQMLNGGESASYAFTADAVDQTLLIDVQRQEIAP